MTESRSQLRSDRSFARLSVSSRYGSGSGSDQCSYILNHSFNSNSNSNSNPNPNLNPKTPKSYGPLSPTLSCFICSISSISSISPLPAACHPPREPSSCDPTLAHKGLGPAEKASSAPSFKRMSRRPAPAPPFHISNNHPPESHQDPDSTSSSAHSSSSAAVDTSTLARCSPLAPPESHSPSPSACGLQPSCPALLPPLTTDFETEPLLASWTFSELFASSNNASCDNAPSQLQHLPPINHHLSPRSLSLLFKSPQPSLLHRHHLLSVIAVPSFSFSFPSPSSPSSFSSSFSQMNSSSSNLPSQNKTSASVEDYDGELTGSPVSSTNLGDDRGLVMEPIDSADDSANTNSASLSSDNNIVASNHANTTMHQSSSSLSSSTSESNTNDSSNNTSSPAPPASSSTSALPLASSGGPVAFSSAFNSIPSSSIMNNQSAPSTAISEDQDGERDRDGLQIADTTAFINNNNDPSGDIDMNSEGSVTSPTQEAVAEPSVAGVAGLPTADVSASSASPSSTTANETSASSALTQKQRDEEEFPYSIRLTPYIDHSSSTVGNYIPSVERIAKNDMTFRVGRLTDRNETGQIRPEHAPVVFRSKVVSRSHAQLIVQNGEWFVQDVKSSSGTFLNHVRLSPQGTQSPKFPLKDGDVLQLGMDFRGGTEDLYKCIKVRVEVNRSWQRRANTFNIDALGKIKNLYGLTSDELQECVICLNPVAPCQALFISPCSHTWHYKCIRPIIVKSYPHFLCPNCRAVCDLEAEIETPEELRAVMDQQQQQQQQQQQTGQGVSAQEVQQS